jgi:hypothetical protein
VSKEERLPVATPLSAEIQETPLALLSMEKPLSAKETDTLPSHSGEVSPQTPPAPIVASNIQETAPTAAATATEYFTLTAAAQADTWLRVIIDEKEQHELLLQSGKTANWQAKEKIVLTVGNVRGTRLDLNGKEIPLPVTNRNVLKDYVITRAMVP